MNHDSRPGRVFGRCRWLLPLWASTALFAAGPVAAQPGTPGMTRTAATLDSWVTPGNAGSEPLIVMLCRPGPDPSTAAQAMPQELPLVCLVTQTDAQTLQMGPARFQELLDRAAQAGTLTVMVLRPQ